MKRYAKNLRGGMASKHPPPGPARDNKRSTNYENVLAMNKQMKKRTTVFVKETDIQPADGGDLSPGDDKGELEESEEALGDDSDLYSEVFLV